MSTARPPEGAHTEAPLREDSRAGTPMTATGMDIQAILKTLPHRYPFVLVDRVLQLDKGVYAKALKNVTVNEPFFNGHFPAMPVMPGVLIIEALAQAAAMLAFVTKGTEAGQGKAGQGKVVYLVGVDGARFKRPVVPGDQLVLEVWQERVKAGIHKYRTQASVDGQVAAECQLMCTERDVA
jgi:3-hydroxyacyl-[acyl-carrier-protein] dehydratase